MFESEMICPRCQTTRLKDWQELTSNEQFVAERLPASAEFSIKERRQHLFCPYCWFETKRQTEKA